MSTVVSWRRKVFICLLLAAYSQLACSIPNLEPPHCTAARNSVKRFYSLHFSGEMRPSAESLRMNRPFLTGELAAELSAGNETAEDYFTATENYPKAFRVGECTAESADRLSLQVLLLWRDDVRSDQKEVQVETVRAGDKWLINKVSK